MDLSASILIYGHDSSLLETRRLVLQHAGFQAGTVMTLEEVRKILVHRPGVLPILCYSLSAEECGQALALIHSLKPARKSLILTAGIPICGWGEEDELLSSFKGPRALVAMVERLVKCKDLREMPNNPAPMSAEQVGPHI